MIKHYNTENREEGGRAFLQQYVRKKDGETKPDITEKGVTVLAMCTTLMACAHQLVRQSGELVYSTSSLDTCNCPTFIMSTCISAGGIPLSVAIISSEGETVITQAMTFLKSVLPPNAFWGKGKMGPDALMTIVMQREQH